MTITPLPTPPDPYRFGSFPDEVTAFFAAMPQMVTEFNALAVGSTDSGTFNALEVNGPINGSGNYVAAVQGPGLLLTSSHNLNNMGPGKYHWLAGSEPLNAPLFPFAYSHAFLMVIEASTGLALQIAGGAFEGSEIDPHINSGLLRRWGEAGGTFESWKLSYDARTVVGLVAQSGGYPTGAVIEKGSNGNGEYTKFADGTMICRINPFTSQNANTALGSIFQSNADATWTYPEPFIAAPVVSGGASGGRWLSISVPGVSSVVIRQLAAVSSASSLGSRLTAIGRWF